MKDFNEYGNRIPLDLVHMKCPGTRKLQRIQPKSHFQRLEEED